MEEFYDITVEGELGRGGEFSSRTFFDHINNAGEKPIRLYLYSGGGLLMDMMAVYDYLTAKQVKFEETMIVGLCGSAATVLSSASKTVSIGEYSSYFIHNPFFPGGGGDDEMLNKYRELLLDLYVKEVAKRNAKVKLSRSEIGEMMDKETLLTAKEAVMYGFADKITSEVALAASFDTDILAVKTFDDYPKAASDNAQKVLDWIAEYGRAEVQGMTRVGLARANQLAKREAISLDTVNRMAQFARHESNAEIAEEFKATPWKDKGYVAWLGWGGDEGIAWAKRTSEKAKKMENKITEELNEQKGVLNWLTKGVKNLLKLNMKNEMRIELEDGTQLYVYTDDGEVEGKEVVLMEDGEITDTPAPNGNHRLNDGREITVENGIITKVTEDMENSNQEALLAAIGETVKNSVNEVKSELGEKLDSLNEGFGDLKSRVEALEGAKASTETEAVEETETAEVEANETEDVLAKKDAELEALQNEIARLKGAKTIVAKTDKDPETAGAGKQEKRSVFEIPGLQAKYGAVIERRMANLSKSTK